PLVEIGGEAHVVVGSVEHDGCESVPVHGVGEALLEQATGAAAAAADDVGDGTRLGVGSLPGHHRVGRVGDHQHVAVHAPDGSYQGAAAGIVRRAGNANGAH